MRVKVFLADRRMRLPGNQKWGLLDTIGYSPSASGRFRFNITELTTAPYLS